MPKALQHIKRYINPKPDNETKREVYTNNIRTIHYVSLLVGAVQLISLVVFIIANKGFSDAAVTHAVARVGSSVVLCGFGYLLSGRMMNNPDVIRDHTRAVRAFVNTFIILLLVWSMFVSVNSYLHYQQILTFYTVELLTVLFVKLHPIFTTAVILTSYTANYLILNFVFIPGLINPYNYFMMALLSAVGGILNYHLTINYISEKNKATVLNRSLESIASHDSTTRLQNRYALNRRVPDCVNRDICVTMGDIDHFKTVNDTYGHNAGDDVLRIFADILLQYFPPESVFRYGGDEFLILTDGSDEAAVRETLKKVNETFSSVRISNITIGLSCSFGCIAARPRNSSELFAALAQADGALYEEKKKNNRCR